MNIYIDCEWNSSKGDLISMALVSEEGNSFYEVLECKNPDIWTREHVMPLLDKDPVVMSYFKKKLYEFLNQYEEVTIIADWPEDIAYFCKALILKPGQCMHTPKLNMKVVHIDSVSQIPHNALADATALRSACMLLT